MTALTATTERHRTDSALPRAELVRVQTALSIADEWRALEANADASFFISWSWIGSWLSMALEAGVEIYLYRCTQNAQTIALGLLSRTRVTRHRIFRRTVLALNEIPQKGLDMIIEYNDLLIQRGDEQNVRARFAEDLRAAPVRWDELQLSGLPEASWQSIAGGSPKLNAIVDETRTPWATDIREINGDIDKLLAPLSRNRRWQIRRSIKAFQEDGELTTEVPATVEQALAHFDDMGRLHTARWNSVGKAGSFANPNWVAFHRAVIREGFARDEIQLLKISAGDNVMGYVYSFIWRGTAYMLQTGFAQEDDNTRRSGIVSHCLAMQYNSTHGVNTYDYMCGDAEYKRTLGAEGAPLVWGRHQLPRLTLRVEQLALRLRGTAESMATEKPNSKE